MTLSFVGLAHMWFRPVAGQAHVARVTTFVGMGLFTVIVSFFILSFIKQSRRTYRASIAFHTAAAALVLLALWAVL